MGHAEPPVWNNVAPPFIRCIPCIRTTQHPFSLNSQIDLFWKLFGCYGRILRAFGTNTDKFVNETAKCILLVPLMLLNCTPDVHASGALPVWVDFSALLAASRLPDYADSSEYILQDLGA
jgi:hypothetical protein